MKEKDAIRLICKHFKRCKNQKNTLFSSDAEIVKMGDRFYSFTIDDFSKEDQMSIKYPYLLGWNFVAATLSDLLAVGSSPKYFLHSIVMTDRFNKSLLKKFVTGIQNALEIFECSVLGGDIGYGKEWRYTGFAFGTFPRGLSPKTRCISLDEGIICVTGKLGDGNLSAFLNGKPSQFEIRKDELSFVSEYLTACIDTSDGFINAIETIQDINNDIEITIDLPDIPYAKDVEKTAKSHNVPKEAFLFGSAGEYELLLFLPEYLERKLSAANIRKLGSFQRNGKGGIFYRKENGTTVVHKTLSPDPREIQDIALYQQKILNITQKLFF